MCIFAGAAREAVKHVSNTNIFARRRDAETQILVYAMKVGADDDVAMILPLPVPPRPAEDAVRFINLERYPRLFDDLRSAFPDPIIPQALSFGGAPAPVARRQLVVHDVGAFEASFVPTLADFGRLDARFSLPPQTWEQMPQYRDWGFAVFKLKGLAAPKTGVLARLFGRDAPVQPAAKEFHPMAFEFRTREPGALFFPTVHVHDGEVHESAAFNHALYCQVPPEAGARLIQQDPAAPGPIPPIFLSGSNEWRSSASRADTFVDAARAEQTIDPAALLYRRLVVGTAPNRDWWVR